MKKHKSTYKYSNVLLVDDTDLDNFINENLLRVSSFSERTYLNTSAKNALEFLNNLTVMGNQFREVFPEVIFIDINMPVMDGFQFIDVFRKTIAKNFAKTKLVVLTSSPAPEDKEKTKAVSENIIFLNKPITREMLDTI
jgi:CheY-like chemotaxis protein